MAGSTDDTTLNLTTDLPDTGNPVIVVGIRVVSGTVKFGNGESAASNNGFTSADGVIYTLHSNNVCPLHFDANNAADTFVIVVVAV